jgi:hypothetical protein
VTAADPEWDAVTADFFKAGVELLAVMEAIPPQVWADPEQWATAWHRYHAEYPVPELAPRTYERAMALFKAGCTLGSVRVVRQSTCLMRRVVRTLRSALVCAA